MKSIFIVTIFNAALLAMCSSAFAGCDCYCAEDDGTVIGKYTFPSVADPSVYPGQCKQSCAQYASTSGEVGLKAAGSCMTQAAPPSVHNTQHLFYRDDKGLIQHIWWANGFHGPDQWNANAAKAASAPAAFVTPSGEQHLFYQDDAGLIQHIFWAGGFHGPDQWNANAAKATDGPAAAF
jgi:hypothetical protein